MYKIINIPGQADHHKLYYYKGVSSKKRPPPMVQKSIKMWGGGKGIKLAVLWVYN